MTPKDHGSRLRGPRVGGGKRERWRSWRLWGRMAHLGLEVTWAKCGGGGVLEVVVVELLLAPGVDGVLA